MTYSRDRKNSTEARRFGAIHRLWMPRPFRRLKKDERGVAAVETAFTFPLMLLLLFGIFEIGRLVYTQAALNFAAEEATRFAVVREGTVTTAEVEAYASSRLLAMVDSTAAVFTASAPVDPVTNTSIFTVQVDYPYSFMVPMISNNSITLTASSTGFLAF